MMEVLKSFAKALFSPGNYNLLHALVILVILDYITGVCVAIRQKKISSKIGAKGIVSKVIIFILVSLSHIIDQHMLGTGVLCETVTILFYCSNELISILENAVRSGVPLPPRLTAILEKTKKEQNKG